MRETCMRTEIKFLGDCAERFNVKQKEWLGFLPEIDKKNCLQCVHGDSDFCQSWITGRIGIRLHCQSDAITREDSEEEFFLFESREDAEVFAKMLFYLWNSDGSTLELDYADLCHHFSSSKNALRPISLSTKEELFKVKSGAVVCFSLRSDSGNALADIYKAAEFIEKVVGDEVACLVTDLIVPKIKNQEITFFYIEG